MASIKIVRRKNKQRKDGTAPLALRISKDYKTNYCFIGQYVLEKDWNTDAGRVKKSHPNSKRLNNYLLKKITEANDLSFEKNDTTSSKLIKKKLQGSRTRNSFYKIAALRIEMKFKRSVFSVAKSELSILYNLEEFMNFDETLSIEDVKNDIKERRKKRISKGRKSEYHWTDAITYFKKNNTLNFEDLNESFIEKYKTFCVLYLEHKTRTKTNQLIFIRTLFNSAINDGIVDKKFYPFGGEKEKIKIGSGNKIGLSSHEIKKIESLESEKDTSIFHTQNLWLFTFYFAGIRISDAIKLKWSDFKNGRLFYVMNKNEKPLSLKVSAKAKAILDYYKKEKNENNGFIFPFLKHVNESDTEDIFRKTRNATKLLNKYLKRIAGVCEIDKNLSNHIARHSFGNIAGNKIHPRMLQKLYRHSDLKTTLIYQANFIHEEADDALEEVINF
ncbi:tyrosine-type recombinase/integrase [Tenacibaculum ovolyticum]|uniref:tyrosine-type recombinase/integrase n=1 Tax=Tenacibaculum ovolyticum TaxID=104270 RepID=UPI001F1AB9AA|nr:tyrosine-type recombinase/integrase [Tenacibaculum ovolyticum]